MHFLPPEDCALLLKTLGRTNNWHKHTRSYGDRINKNIKKNTNDLTGNRLQTCYAFTWPQHGYRRHRYTIFQSV